MSKNKLRLFSIIFTLLVITHGTFFVLLAEKNKKLHKMQQEISYYQDLQLQFAQYSEEYKKQIETVRQENLKKMSDAKKQYEDLLTQQAGIIAAHTQTNFIATSPVLTVKSNTNAGTSTVSVTKPSSKPKTKTS